MPKKKSSTGLRPQIFKGLSKKRMKDKPGIGKNAIIKAGSTIPVQFLQTPDDFSEYEVHVWPEDNSWWYVPCAGKNCPLDDDESEQKAKKSYRFAAVIYNLEARKVQVLEGPKDLARRIYHRWERKPSTFLKRVFEITKFATNPTTYQVDSAEDERPVATKGLKLHDLEEHVLDAMKRYYGDELPDLEEEEELSDLEADEEEDEWEETEDETEEEESDDEDDDDFDAESDDNDDDDFDWSEDLDEDEEEEEPPKKAKSGKKKATAKKKTAGRKKRK